MLGNFGKKLLADLDILLPEDNFPGLVSNLALNAKNEFKGKTSGKGAISAGKGFMLFISNEDLNY